ncbi:hypothetical protein NN802_002407 [Listeria monocytogenes]|uniref:hypothetical protein n=1 Tax=Listeria monocytogenes TaxID=1639 RepID=UPI0034A4F2D4|nr:hypothetical protein [Listeria monocytogenes]
MREIEFRGQNINGHWAHGNLAIIKEKLDRENLWEVADDIEVSGNIHENLDLLEEK